MIAGRQAAQESVGRLHFCAVMAVRLIKVVAAPSNFLGMWLSQFLETLEGLLRYLADTVLSPVGLILIAFIWLIKTGDLYQLLNKIRYMRLNKGDAPVVNVSPYSAETGDVDAKPLNAWQRATLEDIERTESPEEQQYKLRRNLSLMNNCRGILCSCRCCNFYIITGETIYLFIK